MKNQVILLQKHVEHDLPSHDSRYSSNITGGSKGKSGKKTKSKSKGTSGTKSRRRNTRSKSKYN